MRQYLDIVRAVLDDGNPRTNRTGERTLGEFGYTFMHDMRKHFSILSTKYVPFESVIAELVGFVTGADNAYWFDELGTKIWLANANDPGRPDAPNAWLKNPNRKGDGDLGRIYGVQWSQWRRPDGSEVDQLKNLIDGIKRDPFGRRHIVSAWNPGELDQMALPPCHDLFQVNIRGDGTGKPEFVDLFCHMRSVDVFLGMPFNIASYGALLTAIGHCVGLKPRNLHFFFGDTHIYESHLPEMLVQIRRKPNEYADIGIKPRLLVGYQTVVERRADDPRRALYGEMADTEFYEYEPREWGESEDDYKTRCEEGNKPASPLQYLSEFGTENFQLRGYSHQGKLTGKMAV